MRTIVDIARKDLLLLWRDKGGLFFVLVFPLLYGLFFGAIFSGQGGGGGSAIAIAVVDEDRTPESAAFRAALASSPAIAAEDMPFAAANEAVRKGRKVAWLRLPRGFGASNPFGGSAALPQIGVDPSRQAESGVLQGIVMEKRFTGLFGDAAALRRLFERSRQQIETADDLPALQRGLLLTFFQAGSQMLDGAGEDFLASGGGLAAARPEIVSVTRELGARPQTSFDISFPSAILWGVLGAAAGFAITLVRERTQGTLLRLQVAPISRWHVLAGKGLACFTACSAVIALMMAFGALVLGVTISQPALMLVAVVCTALCFTGIMMLVSVLGRTEQAVAGAGWAAFVVMAMIGGGMVPLFVMPSWMLTLSNASPVKWGILALEGAGWRGFSAAELATPCGVLLAIGAACFATGAWRLAARGD